MAHQESDERQPTGPTGGSVTLRDATPDDLPIFFEQQRDPDARHMAAFTAADPDDRDAFVAHWTRNLAAEANVVKTILVDGQVAGNLVSYIMVGEREVGYWLGRAYWGRGVATAALAAFLRDCPTRPLHARVVKDNAASRRVLEKCGFRVTGEDSGYAHGRGAVVEEYLLTLAE